jgi:HAD superfamily hydrolase (TIGR01509 family)
MIVASRDPPVAVIFDIGGTILEERWFDLKSAFRAVLPDAQLADDLSVEFGRVLAEHHQSHREVALASWLLARLSAATLPLDDLEDALWRSVVELAPRNDVGDVLAHLAAARIPVAAVSNAAFSARALAAELKRHGLLDYFCFVISSADFGLRKPHPAIFEAALDRLGVQAARSWFVGDTLSEDIVGAQAAGLQPIWLSGEPAAPIPTAVTLVRDWASLRRLFDSTLVERGAR